MLAPLLPIGYRRDFLPALRMERMRNPDWSGHLLGAGCSLFVG